MERGRNNGIPNNVHACGSGAWTLFRVPLIAIVTPSEKCEYLFDLLMKLTKFVKFLSVYLHIIFI